MSLVGPRPGLLNQEELTEARDRYGVFTVRLALQDYLRLMRSTCLRRNCWLSQMRR